MRAETEFKRLDAWQDHADRNSSVGGPRQKQAKPPFIPDLQHSQAEEEELHHGRNQEDALAEAEAEEGHRGRHECPDKHALIAQHSGCARAEEDGHEHPDQVKWRAEYRADAQGDQGEAVAERPIDSEQHPAFKHHQNGSV